ncbi:MAG: hypothetical protein HRT98_04345 [Mycoplasmatales bacterium]|nr:hypothetical protein [Mycoplasmatales bacterium]
MFKKFKLPKIHKNQAFLIKSGLVYLKNKKSIYFFIMIMLIVSSLSCIPMLLIGKSWNYSWIILATQTICLASIVLYLFNILFINSKYNQLDLLLLSKSKKAKDIFVSKWINVIIFSNIFIISNSFISSIIFTSITSDISMFVPLLFIAIISQNLFAILLILLFSFISLVFRGRVLPLGLCSLVILSIASFGIGFKVLQDNQVNNIDFKYSSKLNHNYVNLYTENNGEITKSIIERENFNGTKTNPSLNNNLFNFENINPFNWIHNFEGSVISKGLSNEDVIINQNFNINQNHFRIISNFWENKPNLKIKGIYPINIKPTFLMNHLEIKRLFSDLYSNFQKINYSDANFQMTRTFIENNNLWQGASIDFRDILFESLGVTGNQEMLYLLRDKEILFQKVPNLFEWMKNSTSKSFSNMIESIYKNENALFNAKNIKLNNRNELVANQVLDIDYKPNNYDIKYFKQIIKINGQNIEFNKKIKLQLTSFKKIFPKENIQTEEEWKTFIDKNSFNVKQMMAIKRTLESIDRTFSNYKFKENKTNITEFHYQYKNLTKTSISIESLSMLIGFMLIVLMIWANFFKLRKVNLKGF